MTDRSGRVVYKMMNVNGVGDVPWHHAIDEQLRTAPIVKVPFSVVICPYCKYPRHTPYSMEVTCTCMRGV